MFYVVMAKVCPHIDELWLYGKSYKCSSLSLGGEVIKSIIVYIYCTGGSIRSCYRLDPISFPLNLAKNSASHPDFILINVKQSSFSEVEHNEHAAEAKLFWILFVVLRYGSLPKLPPLLTEWSCKSSPSLQ